MESIIAEVERAAHLVAGYLESTVSELELTQGEAHVLAQLARRGPTPISALHHEFGHKRSTLTNILDRLERRGLLLRKPNPDDRRSFLLQLTAAGRRAGVRLTRSLDRLEAEITASVGARDLAGFAAVTRSLEGAVRGTAGR